MTKYKCERMYIDSNIDRNCKRGRYWKMITTIRNSNSHGCI